MSVQKKYIILIMIALAVGFIFGIKLRRKVVILKDLRTQKEYKMPLKLFSSDIYISIDKKGALDVHAK